MPADLRSTGRVVAAVVFTMALIVIVIAVRNQRQSAARSASSAQETPPPPPTVTSRAADPSGTLVAGSGKGTWTRVNKSTNLVEFRLHYDRLTPLPGGRAEIDNPEAWFYSSGKPRARISAPRGRVLWPSRDDPPESGDLLGGVRLHAFTDSPDPDHLPATGDALYTLSIDSLHFEGALSQLESPDPLTVTGRGVHAQGTGLTLRFSPATRRLQYFSTLGRLVRIEPDELRRGAQPLGAARSSPRSDDTPTAPSTPMDSYRLALHGSVTLTQGERSASCELLEAWAKLRDGRLADGAVATFDSLTPVPRPARDASQAERHESPAPQAPITLTWAGLLEIQNLIDEPPELADDLLRARLSSPRDAGVTLADAASHARAVAQSIDYGATSRRLRMHAETPGALQLSIDPRFALSAQRLDFNLTSGVGAIPGAGRFVAAADPQDAEPADTTIAWTGRADVTFDTSSGPVGAAGQARIQHLALADNVTATTTDAAASASFALVRFAPPSPDDRPGAPPLPLRLELRGNAAAHNHDSLVRAQDITVAFAPVPDHRGRAVPVAASARGDAHARQGNDSIDADAFDAAIEPGPDSRPRITRFTATDSVRFVGADSVSARADRLTADVTARRAELQGTPAFIERAPDAADQPSQSLAAHTILLDASARTVATPCPGSAESRDPAESLAVTWSGSMTYDDLNGIAEIDGEVTARADRNTTDRFTAASHHARVELTPAPDSRAAGTPPRRIEQVRLTRADAPDAAPVEVQARRYAPGSDPAAIDAGTATREALVSLRALDLVVRPADRTIRIPGPGRLVIDDQRAVTANSNALSGSTVLQWLGSLEPGTDGSLRITGSVELRHLALGAAEATRMDAGSLTAWIDWPPDGAPDLKPTLRRVSAEDSVFVIHKNLRFTGDLLGYDAGASEVIVEGRPGAARAVTIFDASTSVTTTADAISLDPRTGLWRTTAAGTISFPR